MMKKIISILIITLITVSSFSQVGIGTTTPDPSAQLDIVSTTHGVLIPRMTTVQRDSIVNPAIGLQIFNLDSNCFNYFNNNWLEVCGDNMATYNIGSGVDCVNNTVNGTYIISTILDGTNTVTLDATVTTPGKWVITSNFLNGYLFYGSGTFTATGIQQVTLNAIGTPIDCNTDSFNFIGNGGSGGVCIIANINVEPRSSTDWAPANLGGAVATSSTDAAAYGDLYQWGRGSDGHQLRTSSVTVLEATSATDNPGHGDFILTNVNPYDWRIPQNDNLWQGVAGINNPCPAGMRIPTRTEFICEVNSWASPNTAAEAFASPQKWTVGGLRSNVDGNLNSVGIEGHYWTSTTSYSLFINSNASTSIVLSSGITGISSSARSSGKSVRCLND